MYYLFQVWKLNSKIEYHNFAINHHNKTSKVILCSPSITELYIVEPLESIDYHESSVQQV